MQHDTSDHRLRHLSADEEAMLNDYWHEIGCDCSDCRPDLHADIAAHAEHTEAA